MSGGTNAILLGLIEWEFIYRLPHDLIFLLSKMEVQFFSFIEKTIGNVIEWFKCNKGKCAKRLIYFKTFVKLHNKLCFSFKFTLCWSSKLNLFKINSLFNSWSVTLNIFDSTASLYVFIVTLILLEKWSFALYLLNIWRVSWFIQLSNSCLILQDLSISKLDLMISNIEIVGARELSWNLSVQE